MACNCWCCWCFSWSDPLQIHYPYSLNRPKTKHDWWDKYIHLLACARLPYLLLNTDWSERSMDDHWGNTNSKFSRKRFDYIQIKCLRLHIILCYLLGDYFIKNDFCLPIISAYGIRSLSRSLANCVRKCWVLIGKWICFFLFSVFSSPFGNHECVHIHFRLVDVNADWLREQKPRLVQTSACVQCTGAYLAWA